MVACFLVLGVHGGVATLLRKLNPFMTSSHFAAHREALAAREAADSSPYSGEFDSIVTALAVYVSRSPQRTAKLKEVQKEVGEKTLQLCKVNKVRWLSRSAAVSSIYRTLRELMTLFNPDQSEGQGDPQPDHFRSLTSFRFLFALHFLVDLLNILSRLNRAFQRPWVDPTQIRQLVEGTIATISEHFVTPTAESASGSALPGTLPSLVRGFWTKFVE